MGNRTGDVNDVMPGSDGVRILWFEKKTVSWDSTLDEGSRFSELAEARPVVCGEVLHVVGSDGKVSIERNCVCVCVSLSLSLSLLVSINLKLKKVIKSFVPEPISCFSDSCAYEHYEHSILWTFFTYSYLGRILDVDILHNDHTIFQIWLLSVLLS